ncbi:MAG: GGDEF domain-containing protein [Pseudomonadota bacterium]
MVDRRTPPGQEPPTSLTTLFEIYGLMKTPYAFAIEKLNDVSFGHLQSDIIRLDHINYDTRVNTLALISLAYESHKQIKKLSWDLRKSQVRRAQLELEKDELEKIAYVDDLTEIFNRKSFLRELNAELSRFNNPKRAAANKNDGAAVVFVDLRKFKPINDTYGHAAGDAALKKVAEILQECVREDDVVGRWGGDEFVVMIKNINSPDGESVFERINQALDNITFDYDGQTIGFSARTGIFHISPNQEADHIMHEADMAMINSKDPRDRQGAVKLIDNGLKPG